MQKKLLSLKTAITLLAIILIGNKVNAQATTFQESIGGAQEEYAYDAHQTTDGGYVFGGVTLSYPTSNSGNSYVVKLNKIGDTVWTSVFGDNCGSVHYVNDIVETSDKGYLTCGGKVPCSGNLAGNIVRLDETGKVVWAKTCSQNEDPYPCIQDKAGNFIVGGYVTGVGAGMLDGCIMKLNSNGDTIWSRTYGGASNDWFYHIIQTADHGYIASGFTSSFGQGDTDIYVVKVDSNGKLQWSNAYGTATHDESAFGHSIQATTDGGYIVTGSTGNTQGIFLMKLNSTGTMLWAKQYDGAYGHAVKQTPDKGFVITGQNTAITNGIELIKTDTSGNVLWSKIYTAGATRYEGFFLDLTKDGGFITGGENTTANFRDMYIIKTDSAGNSGCNETNPAITSSAAPFIQAIAATQVLIGANTVTDPYLSYRNGAVNNYCLKVGDTTTNTTGIIAVQGKQTSISIYPNPVENILHINYGSIGKSLNEIYDVTGRKMTSFNTNSSEYTANLGGFSSGVYFIKVTTNDKTDFIKFVKK